MTEFLTAEERTQLANSFEERSAEFRADLRKEVESVRIILQGKGVSSSFASGILSVEHSESGSRQACPPESPEG